MKKLIALVVTLVCVAVVAGVAKQPAKDNESDFGTGFGNQNGSEKALLNSQVMTDPVVSVCIRNIFTGERAEIIENEDIRAFSNIVYADSWNIESLTNCSSNIEIIIDGTTYMYHSACGTFNDTINQRYLSLDNETTKVLNALFEKYVSLTLTEFPAE